MSASSRARIQNLTCFLNPAISARLDSRLRGNDGKGPYAGTPSFFCRLEDEVVY